mgnify:CR=1 FL=1
MDLERAIAVAHAIADRDVRNGALRQLAVMLVQAGQPEQAVLLACAIDDQQVRDAALAEIVVAIGQAGDPGAAVAVARLSADRATSGTSRSVN